MKIQNALVSNIFDRSQRYFAHVTTVTLSWRVQNIVVIGRVYFTLECFEFSSNFEFDRNMLSGTGAWSQFYTLGRHILYAKLNKNVKTFFRKKHSNLSPTHRFHFIQATAFSYILSYTCIQSTLETSRPNITHTARITRVEYRPNFELIKDTPSTFIWHIHIVKMATTLQTTFKIHFLL